jgi:hypothetical protein
MKTIKIKNIKIEEELTIQLEILCEVLHTNFSSKTKELLVEWKINELKRLKEDAPELFLAYQEKIGNKKGSSN